MTRRLLATLDRLIQWMERGSRYLAWAAGVLLFIAVAMVTVDVLSRKLLGHSIGASTELSGYILAIVTSWSLSYGLFCKAHIRIDVAYVPLPQLCRAVLDLVALVTLMLFSAILCLFAYDVADGSLVQHSLANTPLQTPLWVPQFLWLGGIAWFTLTVALMLIRVLVALATRDFATVQRLSGSPTVADQVDDASGAEQGG